jgi:lysophospholipase
VFFCFHPGYDWHTLSSLQTKIKTYPTLYDKDYCITTDEKHCFEPFQPIPLPFVRDSKHRVLYCITEYDPLMDSCNMNMDDWAKLARDIEKHYEQFDGFVILHGTDTMCYTASALSFMLENLGKPVILTGAQVATYCTQINLFVNLSCHCLKQEVMPMETCWGLF